MLIENISWNFLYFEMSCFSSNKDDHTSTHEWTINECRTHFSPPSPPSKILFSTIFVYKQFSKYMSCAMNTFDPSRTSSVMFFDNILISYQNFEFLGMIFYGKWNFKGLFLLKYKIILSVYLSLLDDLLLPLHMPSYNIPAKRLKLFTLNTSHICLSRLSLAWTTTWEGFTLLLSSLIELVHRWDGENSEI